MNQVKEKSHCRYHELKNQHMRKPGTEHWQVYAKAYTALPPTTMRMLEVEIQGFPETDPEILNPQCVLFGKLKQGEEPVAVSI